MYYFRVKEVESGTKSHSNFITSMTLAIRFNLGDLLPTERPSLDKYPADGESLSVIRRSKIF